MMIYLSSTRLQGRGQSIQDSKGQGQPGKDRKAWSIQSKWDQEQQQQQQQEEQEQQQDDDR